MLHPGLLRLTLVPSFIEFLETANYLWILEALSPFPHQAFITVFALSITSVADELSQLASSTRFTSS